MLKGLLTRTRSRSFFLFLIVLGDRCDLRIKEEKNIQEKKGNKERRSSLTTKRALPLDDVFM